jgi:hypothetical protein
MMISLQLYPMLQIVFPQEIRYSLVLSFSLLLSADNSGIVTSKREAIVILIYVMLIWLVVSITYLGHMISMRTDVVTQ